MIRTLTARICNCLRGVFPDALRGQGGGVVVSPPPQEYVQPFHELEIVAARFAAKQEQARALQTPEYQMECE